MKREITDETYIKSWTGQFIPQMSSIDQQEDSNFTEPQGIREPLLLTVPQVAQCLHLSRAMVYELITRREIPVIHFGRAIRVSLDSLRQRIKELEEQQASDLIEANNAFSSKKQQSATLHKKKIGE